MKENKKEIAVGQNLQPKIPFMVRVIALLMLVSGVSAVLFALYMLLSFSSKESAGVVSFFIGTYAYILIIIGIIMSLLAFGVRNLKPWSLWLLAIFAGLEIILYLFGFYLSTSVSNIGQNFIILFFNIAFSVLVPLYLWLSYFYVYKNLSQGLNTLRKVLQAIILAFFIFGITILIFLIITLIIVIKKPVNQNTSLPVKYGTSSAQMKGNDSKRKSDLRDISNAVEIYYSDFGSYPTVSDFEELVAVLLEKGYIDEKLKDPAYPSRQYRYGVSSDGLYYRIDTQLEIDDEAMINDGGISELYYEIGNAVDSNKDEVTSMR